MSENVGYNSKISYTTAQMDFQKVLKLADDLVFTHTGEHLDALQNSILRGVWQGEKYAKIADDFHLSEGHVRDVASELWKILSDALGENLNKSNVCARLERLQFTNFSHFEKAYVASGDINICRQNSPAPDIPHRPPQQQQTTPQSRQDLSQMPASSAFYGRTEELTGLEKSILQKHCRIVAVLGITGTGKTAIISTLIAQISDKFEFVIWQSLRTSPPLKNIQINLIQFLSNSENSDFSENKETQSQLIKYLQKYRCLIVCDDVQQILSSGEMAGNYKPGYEDYGEFFKLATELSHNSCIVLAGWELPREIAAIKSNKSPVHLLQIKSLEEEPAIQLLKDQGLEETQQYRELIKRYQGNPLWLKLVATIIEDLFNGRIDDFLEYDNCFVGEDLKNLLAQHYNRLSEVEKMVLSALAKESEPVSLPNLREKVEIEPENLLSAIQSLTRRCLIEKEKSLFSLESVIKQFICRLG